MQNKLDSLVLKERLAVYGVEALFTEEVISLLTGIPFDIVKDATDNFGLIDLVKYSNTLNITPVKRRNLELLYSFYSRMRNVPTKDKYLLNSSSKSGDYCTNLFINMAYECFYVLCLDSQNRVNQAVMVHNGTINETAVYPRVIVETALKYLANSVILAHNHPGGSLQPSAADTELTKKITTALDSIGIKVVDHIIVAGDKFTSFAEKGLI